MPDARALRGRVCADLFHDFSSNVLLAAATAAFSQNDYKVITVNDGGTISGTVKWSGPVPHALDFPVTKDPQICDPDSKKTADLERLIIGPRAAWPTPSSI